MLDYVCSEGEWEPRELVDWKLIIPVDDGSQKPIYSLSPYESRKASDVEGCTSGGSAMQLEPIRTKVSIWKAISEYMYLRYSI